jgi:hypothetical protein
VGFLWGSAAVSLSCGVSVGLAEAPDWAGRPGTGYPSPADSRILMTTFRVTQCHLSDAPAYGNSAPNAEYFPIDPRGSDGHRNAQDIQFCALGRALSPSASAQRQVSRISISLVAAGQPALSIAF